MTVDDEAAIEAMLILATAPATAPSSPGKVGGWPRGLLTCLGEPVTRHALELNTDSRVLLFNTEGATDPVIYRSLLVSILLRKGGAMPSFDPHMDPLPGAVA